MPYADAYRVFCPFVPKTTHLPYTTLESETILPQVAAKLKQRITHQGVTSIVPQAVAQLTDVSGDLTIANHHLLVMFLQQPTNKAR